MFSYLLRRILLFFPTLIGATAVIFMVMSLAPISIVDVLLPPGGDLLPGQRAVREQYIQERYGLNKPAYVQYFRWLNKISPVGFETWKRDDQEVVAVKQQEQEQRKARIKELMATGIAEPAATEQARKIDLSPDPGDLRLNKPTFKSPDLGTSIIQSRPAVDRIREALPVSIILELLSLPLSMAIAVYTGIRAARVRGQLQDKGIGFVLLALYSLPVIWVAVMLQGYLANVEYLKWFPTDGLHELRSEEMNFLPTFSGGFQRGYLLDGLWHLVLPVIALSYGSVAYYSKLTRTSLLEVLGADFVRTARAKGLPDNVVTYRHAFRNSLLPLITVSASFLRYLVTGSIVVETIFGINGMGRLVVMSLMANDFELFLSTSVIILVLQLVGNLLADVLYVIADPRVTYD